MSLRIIIRTERRIFSDSPVVTDFMTFEIDEPTIEEYLMTGGYNEDGTFEVRQVIGVEHIR